MPLLLLGRSCPLQIILLCDLVGCADSNVSLAHFFKKLMYFEQPLLSAAGPTQQVKIQKSVPNGHYSTFCRGLSHPTGWTALPSGNISQCFFKGREIRIRKDKDSFELMNTAGPGEPSDE